MPFEKLPHISSDITPEKGWKLMNLLFPLFCDPLDSKKSFLWFYSLIFSQKAFDPFESRMQMAGNFTPGLETRWSQPFWPTACWYFCVVLNWKASVSFAAKSLMNSIPLSATLAWFSLEDYFSGLTELHHLPHQQQQQQQQPQQETLCRGESGWHCALCLPKSWQHWSFPSTFTYPDNFALIFMPLDITKMVQQRPMYTHLKR